MKKFLAVTIGLLLITGCNPKREVVDVINGTNGTNGINGTNGTNGINGTNGHSIVSQSSEATGCECENGGSRLDLYLDRDDDLSISEADLYLSSIVACNGLNGLRGAQGLTGATGAVGAIGAAGPTGHAGAIGPQGIQGLTGVQGPTGPIGPTGPQGIQGPSGSSGATIVAYTSASCTLIAGTSYYAKPNGVNGKIYSSSSCSSSSSVVELGNGDSFWVGTNKLAVDYDDIGIKVITFN